MDCRCFELLQHKRCNYNETFETTTVSYSYSLSLDTKGDTNLDDKVAIADIVLLQQYMVNKQMLTENQMIISDMNNDNIVNVV